MMRRDSTRPEPHRLLGTVQGEKSGWHGPRSDPISYWEVPQGEIGPGTAGSAAEMTTLPRWRLPESYSQGDSHVSCLTKVTKENLKARLSSDTHAHTLRCREGTRCKCRRTVTSQMTLSMCRMKESLKCTFNT